MGISSKLCPQLIFIMILLFSAGCVDLDGSIKGDSTIVNLEGTWEIIYDKRWNGSEYITETYPMPYAEGIPLEAGKVRAYITIIDGHLKYYKKVENVAEVEGQPKKNGLFYYSDFTASFSVDETGVIKTKYNGSDVTGTFEINGGECIYTLTIDDTGNTFQRDMLQIYEFSIDGMVTI